MSTLARNADSVRLWTGAPVCVLNSGVGRANAADASRTPAIALVQGTWPEASPSANRVLLASEGNVKLYDWTPTTGTQHLTPGQSYYLSNTSGRLTTSPFPAGYAVNQLIGVAIDAGTLSLRISQNDTDLNVIKTGTQHVGDVLTSLGNTRTWLPSVASASEMINVKDFGAVGDGITDDTAAIETAMLAGWVWNGVNWSDSTTDRYRIVFFPPGIYLVKHPITVPWYRRVVGSGRGLEGTTILAAADFDVNWNITFTETPAWPGITRIPAGIFQSNTWAPDPTGANRWIFNGSYNWPTLPWSIGSYWNGGQIYDLMLDGQNVAGLNGLCIETFGENSLLSGLWIQNFVRGLWATGNHTGGALENSSIWWTTQGGVCFTSNPFWHSYGRVNGDGNLNGKTGGEFLIKRLSGDANSPAMIYYTCPVNLSIQQLKIEHPLLSTDNVIRVDVDPTFIGTNSGMNIGARGSIGLWGGNFQNAIITPPHAGETAPDFCRIKKTGTENYLEWPKPVILRMNGQSYWRNFVVDETYQTTYTGPASTRTIGLDGTGQDFSWGCAFEVYSNDFNEFSGIRTNTFPSLAALADVQLTNPQNGDKLTYSAALGKWVNTP